MAFDKAKYLEEFDGIVRFYRAAHLDNLKCGVEDWIAHDDPEIQALFSTIQDEEDYEICKAMVDAWKIYDAFDYDDVVDEFLESDASRPGAIEVYKNIKRFIADERNKKDEEDDEERD